MLATGALQAPCLDIPIDAELAEAMHGFTLDQAAEVRSETQRYAEDLAEMLRYPDRAIPYVLDPLAQPISEASIDALLAELVRRRVAAFWGVEVTR
jgi:hypothetical protein